MSQKESKKTLVDLTRAFISLLKAAGGDVVDLAKAEVSLGASKRRLYDVSNVLSGVGLIERCGKARVKWIGYTPGIGGDEMHTLLAEKNRELDDMIGIVDTCLNDLSKSPSFQSYAWVTEEDVATLDPDGSVNLFALRGPSSMTIQIIDQEDGEHHMVCKTDEGKIEMIQVDPARRR